MNNKFWYMKLLGFFITIIGFSYCLTSFFNLFEFLFGNKLIVEGANMWIMGIGLIFPLFIFIFGVFFYFYSDTLPGDNNRNILISIIITVVISIINIILSIIKLSTDFFEDLFMLIHPSFGYSVLIISVLLVYGKYKYKY